MNLLKLLNVSAMFSLAFTTYIWLLSLIHVVLEHPSQDAITITLAFFFDDIWIWIVLIVNLVKLKEPKKE